VTQPLHYETFTHAILLGPIRGTVTLASGEEVDVRPDVIEGSNAERAAEIAHLVGLRYAAEGHPKHDPGDPFIYEAPDGTRHDAESAKAELTRLKAARNG